ncbi:hypothetical protein ALP39_04892 [Pseudomonas marginalis pv. marginalis]|nr:hypothetical protein ALP39_04892 [Pseudomonas marginalis pv. marginalis]
MALQRLARRLIKQLAVLRRKPSQVGKAPPQGDLGDGADRAMFKNFLAHRTQPVLLQVGHRRQGKVLAERVEQLEARHARGGFQIFQVHRFAGVVVNVLARADQIMRQLHTEYVTQFLGVVIRLGQDQTLDQRAFQVAGKRGLLVQLAAALQLGDKVARHAPPRRRGAVHRVHHGFKAQRRVDGPLQQTFQGFTHRRPRNHHLQLAAVAGNRQHLVLVGRDDHALIAVGTQALTVLAQLLLTHQRQAEAVAAEVLGILDVDGHVGAVLDHTQRRGAGLEHIGAVVETQALGGRRRQAVRPADAGHPAAGAFKVEALDTDIACLAAHQGAPTAVRRLRALAARRYRCWTASFAPRRWYRH